MWSSPVFQKVLLPRIAWCSKLRTLFWGRSLAPSSVPFECSVIVLGVAAVGNVQQIDLVCLFHLVEPLTSMSKKQETSMPVSPASRWSQFLFRWLKLTSDFLSWGLTNALGCTHLQQHHKDPQWRHDRYLLPGPSLVPFLGCIVSRTSHWCFRTLIFSVNASGDFSFAWLHIDVFAPACNFFAIKVG